MARQKSLIRLEGTFMGTTHVNSKAYGEHVRAARGTHKEAALNHAFKKSADDLMLSNLPAKIINDALAPLRQNLGGGMLWQEFVSLFKKQYRDKGVFDFTALTKWEVHKSYPLSRLITFSRVHAETDTSIRTVSLTVGYEGAFQFKRNYIDGYRFSVQAIFRVMEDKMAYTEVRQLPVLSLGGKAQEHEFTFAIPAKATVVLFAVKLEGCVAGEEDKSHATKGMRIEATLKINE